MDEYLVLLVLVYFKEHTLEYDLEELRERIGVTFEQLFELINYMFEEKLLKYVELKMTLSFKGRLLLMNSNMENYTEREQCNVQTFKERWPMDKPFYVHDFSKKKWRNS